jgi:hypothetical protein
MTDPMRRTPAGRLAVGLSLLLGAVLVARPVARQAELPPARQIVDRFVTAMGGEAAFRAIKSIHAHGQLQVAAQQITGELDLYSARPAKVLYRVTVPGVGVIEHAYDGKVGWSLSPVTGPELLAGRELSEAADDAWFDSPLHSADRLRELTTIAKTDFDGHPAYKVKVVHLSGHEQVEYFDADTGLQLGSEGDQASPQGVVHTVNIMRDYRRVGRLMQAMTFVQRALGFEQIVTLSTVEYDAVPESLFDPPAEVKALLPR